MKILRVNAVVAVLRRGTGAGVVVLRNGTSAAIDGLE